MPILHQENVRDWLKALVLAASLGGAVGVLELWFFEFSTTRLLAALLTGATFGIVFVAITRIAPVEAPTRSYGVLCAIPAGLAGGAVWWLATAPAISVWMALGAGAVLGSIFVLAEW